MAYMGCHILLRVQWEWCWDHQTCHDVFEINNFTADTEGAATTLRLFWETGDWRLETGDCHNPTIREWRWYNIWQTALPDNVYSRTWPKMTLWKAVGNARKRSLCSTKTQANEMWIFILKCLSKNNEGINYYFYEK